MLARPRYSALPVIITIILLFLPPAALSATVALSWGKPNCTGLGGYNIYYGPKGSNFKAYPKLSITSPHQTNCKIANLNPGETYHFAATSVDYRGNESRFSAVISYSIPHLPGKHQRAASQAIRTLLLAQ